jgi:hypothetical protein
LLLTIHGAVVSDRDAAAAITTTAVEAFDPRRASSEVRIKAAERASCGFRTPIVV